MIEGIGNEVTQFESGAVRDIQEDKGRCDLMPLWVVGDVVDLYHETFLEIHRTPEHLLVLQIFQNLDRYIYSGDVKSLEICICNFVSISLTWCEYVECDKMVFAMLDVSKHYKQGLEKYGERNWEKGIPLHSFIDSASRHFLKYLAHFKDERHDLAFIWNLLCCIHTHKRIDNNSLMDLPFCNNKNTNVEPIKQITKNPLGWKTELNKEETNS